MAMNANMAIQTKAKMVSLTSEVPVILNSGSGVLDILAGPGGAVFTEESQGKRERLTRWEPPGSFRIKMGDASQSHAKLFLTRRVSVIK